MTAALNAYSDTREYGTDVDVYGNVFEWEVAAPNVTARLALLGASQERTDLIGASSHRTTLEGAPQERIELRGHDG